MTYKEFWNKYINENILDIFDLTCDFFTEEFPEEFIENYDVGEVIVETKGHQEDNKNFDNVFRFLEILRNNHPELYKEKFQYLDDFLIDYYCFLQDEANVRLAFANFMNYPTQSYNLYLIAFKKINVLSVYGNIK